jgi:hypothetical protein
MVSLMVRSRSISALMRSWSIAANPDDWSRGLPLISSYAAVSLRPATSSQVTPFSQALFRTSWTVDLAQPHADAICDCDMRLAWCLRMSR